jgi:hypothetical protein
MELPDIGKTVIYHRRRYVIVARTQILEEAVEIAKRYSEMGFETKIISRQQTGFVVYEVWVSKRHDMPPISPMTVSRGEGRPGSPRPPIEPLRP